MMPATQTTFTERFINWVERFMVFRISLLIEASQMLSIRGSAVKEKILTQTELISIWLKH